MISFNNFATAQMERIARKPIKRNPQDYEQDGLIFCGDCNEPKQKRIEWAVDTEGATTQRLVPVMCKCERDEFEHEEQAEKKRKFEVDLKQLRDEFCLQPPNVDKNTFAVDDDPAGQISDVCRRYVAEWENMREKNIGIIFFGPKGIGKSFYAACIANALAEKQVRTCFTTTARLMNVLQGSWDKTAIIDNLNNFRLLVLDDLGAERDTAYGSELMYNIIDSRYRAKMPLIVTTNLDLADMKAETDIWRSRIYDRVIEMCPIPLKMLGASRRTGVADERKELARDFLRNAKRQEDTPCKS